MTQTNNSPATSHEAEGVETAGGAHAGFWTLTLGSIGVVYGDIGTSPLYAVREALLAASGHAGGSAPMVTPSNEAVLGVVSLILWTLMLIVTLKYVVILLRADNDGEGGTLSLMALAKRALGGSAPVIMLLGMMAAGLFYGDALITPAISVLSAVEGLKLITPALDPYILPITLGIIVALFAAQSHGTAKVAALFGPITLVWFAAMAWGGLMHIGDEPRILAALNPIHAVRFLISHGVIGLVTLGAVFLAVTGAEALYADLGHFGRRPIQFAWLALVFPALAINYLGQGALVLHSPEALENPFFKLYPDWALIPMVILATAATVIASQAVITGAYSLSRQAIQLGLLPRLDIRHTSDSHAGQIYLPQVNWLILIGVLVLVVFFGSSSRLASAYGIAVTGTMVVTAIMAFIVIWKVWKWPLWGAALLILPFLMMDLVFLSANMLKVVDGGWVPLMLACFIILMMRIWVKGSRILAEKTRRIEVPLQSFIDSLEKRPPPLVSGTGVYLTGDTEFAPASLLHNLKHYKVLHERNVFLTVRYSMRPYVSQADRLKIEQLTEHFSRMELTYGYMQRPSIPKCLALARKCGFAFDIMKTSFFLSRRSLKPSVNSDMPLWQDKIFISLSRSATDATDFFQIPTDRVVEVGTQVTV